MVLVDHFNRSYFLFIIEVNEEKETEFHFSERTKLHPQNTDIIEASEEKKIYFLFLSERPARHMPTPRVKVRPQRLISAPF